MHKGALAKTDDSDLFGMGGPSGSDGIAAVTTSDGGRFFVYIKGCPNRTGSPPLPPWGMGSPGPLGSGAEQGVQYGLGVLVSARSRGRMGALGASITQMF